jgi:hypothetical protein
MRQQEKNLKQEITQPNLQQFQQELSGRNSCMCYCCRFATSAHSIALFELHYNRNGLQTRCYNSLSLSAFPFLFLSLLLLLIDRRPQRIELHFLKTPLSCATDSKSHRENTYRKRPKKSLWRITKLTLTKTTSYHRLTRVTTGHSLLHRPFPSPTPQNLRHRQTDVVNLYIGLDF